MNSRPIPPAFFVKGGTPNDGLPDSWRPVEEPPRIVGRTPEPASAPQPANEGPGGFFSYSLPMSFQLTPDIMLTRYPLSLASYRIMPPGTAGVASNVAAAQSATSGT